MPRCELGVAAGEYVPRGRSRVAVLVGCSRCRGGSGLPGTGMRFGGPCLRVARCGA